MVKWNKDKALANFYILFVLIGAFVLWTQIRRVDHQNRLIAGAQHLICTRSAADRKLINTAHTTLKELIVELIATRQKFMAVETDPLKRVVDQQAIARYSSLYKQIHTLPSRVCDISEGQ